MAHHVPDHETVRTLILEGRTGAEIAVDLNFPRPLVDIAMGEGVKSAPRTAALPAQPTALIPWTIAAEHEAEEDARLLHLEESRRTGARLTDIELDLLTDWMDRLREADVVVTYDPSTGFSRVPRTAGEWGPTRQAEAGF